MLAGLAHCETPYLATVPCDAPNFPLDLVSTAGQRTERGEGDIATAYTRAGDGLFPQPVFCLMKTVARATALRAFIAGGERKTGFVGRADSATPEWSSRTRPSSININTTHRLDAIPRKFTAPWLSHRP